MDATVGALAASLGGEVVGNPDLAITNALALSKSGPESITFLGDETKTRELINASAAAIFISRSRVEELTDELTAKHTFVIVEDALDAFIATLKQHRSERARPQIGISPQAFVAESATIGEGVNVFPGAYIGEQAVIGSNCDIHPGAYIGDGSTLANDVTIHANVVIYFDVTIGNRVIIHAGAVIGADGFGYRFRDGRFEKIPQLGTVQIHDDVEIGANTTIDRGMIGPTIIAQGTKIDNLVMIAHNCEIGKHNAFASQVGIAGSCTTGDYVRAGGQAGIGDHLNIGSGASLAASSGHHKDVPAGETWAGAPARRLDETIRIVMAQGKLPEMRSTVRSLEKQVAKLTAEIKQLTVNQSEAA
ncbi:MAG: UDP-3-O-(3-hydroxymyristoyl)glucosamine N-acyltransferase [Rhodopirellula sp.]|nr:UDP-3-O-(3-hydroxymyristoyl)glucosamine N-acyltransferase [Rhodopirellula sp.]